jgi:hypothetical protein
MEKNIRERVKTLKKLLTKLTFHVIIQEKKAKELQLTKVQAAELFKFAFLPAFKDSSRTTIRCAWNDFVDGLCRDGHITENQQNRWAQPSFCN